ncbi:hypothetical protein [Acinetobacter schindleri]|uniref:hypothetical protein n=1 Tax=Acinetobacter schindleri TaxID=108981 RepID=UPI00289F71C4|nr:hypothetical protein [Acinetobacter schindleri]
MSNFLEAIKAGISAADVKKDNLAKIFDVIKEAKDDIEEFSNKSLTLVQKVSQIDVVHSFAVKMSTPQYNKTKPLNQVLFVQLTSNENKSEELTMLFLGSEGFPCTIYVEGNQLTAGDENTFRENIKVLLGSPSTGEKIGRLLNEAQKINN